MKLPVWPEENQEDVPAPPTSYNSDQEISNTPSDDEAADVDGNNA